MDEGEADLTVDDALDEVHELQGYRGALRRRAAGLTWIVWGLVLAGMVLSYDQWALAADRTGPAIDRVLRLMFVPWLGLGALVTWIVWRSMGVVMPGRAGLSGLRWAGRLAAVALVGVGAVFLTNSLVSDVTSTAVLMVGLGAATVLAGALGLVGSNGLDRRIAAGIGGLVAVVALLAMSLGEPGTQALFDTFAWLGPVTILGAYIGGGAFLALRG